MTGSGEAARVTPAAAAIAELAPAARAVLRWLPTPEPSGAFAGQHDRVHCPGDDLHARVSLWWSEQPVHPGDRVGPPRGGLVPSADATYAVALPSGGYLWIEGGSLTRWQARAKPRVPLLRADGEVFEPARYSTVRPYFRRQYGRMTVPTIRTALTSAGLGPVTDELLNQIVGGIAAATDPVVCGCGGQSPTAPAEPTGWTIPDSLLQDPATLQVLVGEGDATQAAAVLWRLSERIWDPVRVGRANAALAALDGAEVLAAGAPVPPEEPITEHTVAQIASQAVRWHGAAVVRTMPAWLLGWVMVARPVLLLSAGQDDRAVAEGLDWADRVRVARVETQWHATASARLLISRSSQRLADLDDPDSGIWEHLAAPDSLDLRSHAPTRPDLSTDPIGRFATRELVQRAYRCDVRSWFGLARDQG